MPTLREKKRERENIKIKKDFKSLNYFQIHFIYLFYTN